jgi:hypothetical protein
VHIALGVRADGSKEILGLWLEQNEGAKFWRRVMNELKNRGVEDVLIAIIDGLKGFPEAITAVFPQATVQTGIVHLLRHSLDFVSWKDRNPVAAALKDIYRAIDADAAQAALGVCEESPWGRKYPAIAQSWRRAWAEIIPFYAFPYLERCRARRGSDLRIEAPGQARQRAMLGAFDPVPRGSSLGAEDPRYLLVHTSPSKRSTDFVALLDQLGAAYGTAERTRPLVAVLDNGPILRSKLTARARPAHLAHPRMVAQIRARAE